jgi:hypothetical protein
VKCSYWLRKLLYSIWNRNFVISYVNFYCVLAAFFMWPMNWQWLTTHRKRKRKWKTRKPKPKWFLSSFLVHLSFNLLTTEAHTHTLLTYIHNYIYMHTFRTISLTVQTNFNVVIDVVVFRFVFLSISFVLSFLALSLPTNAVIMVSQLIFFLF